MKFDNLVILLGRGGSGTRLLSQLALDVGIFIGNRLNKSNDSIEWVDLIYRMVSEVGGKQQLPTGSRYRSEIKKRAREILSRSFAVEDYAWGWKLPETMLVLPLFLDAFPEAKVIHLVRHPVSSSLRRSHITSRLGNPVGNVVLPAAYEYGGRDVSFMTTDPVYLHNAYSWNYQVTRVMHYGRDILGAAQYREFKYEDFCTDVENAFSSMSLFLKLPIQQSLAGIEIDDQRIQQQRHEEQEALKVWDICGQTAEALGYSKGHWL